MRRFSTMLAGTASMLLALTLAGETPATPQAETVSLPENLVADVIVVRRPPPPPVVVRRPPPPPPPRVGHRPPPPPRAGHRPPPPRY